MKRFLVRYKVKRELAAKNEELVRGVYEELRRTTPKGIRYATFKLDDGVSFVHIASIETEDEHNPLPTVVAFQKFQEAIKDRCEEPPVAVEMHEVGAYQFFEN